MCSKEIKVQRDIQILTDEGVDGAEDGPDPRGGATSAPEVQQEVEVEEAEAEDDAVEGDVAEEGGEEYDPRPAAVPPRRRSHRPRRRRHRPK